MDIRKEAESYFDKNPELQASLKDNVGAANISGTIGMGAKITCTLVLAYLVYVVAKANLSPIAFNMLVGGIIVQIVSRTHIFFLQKATEKEMTKHFEKMLTEIKKDR